MGEGRSIWVGKDDHHGVLAQPRKDLRPPPHWRLEAVAATPMPRSLTIGADRRRAVFIEDSDTSDVFLLDLESGSVPERLTTGRDPMPWWEDTPPYLSPDGGTVAYADDATLTDKSAKDFGVIPGLAKSWTRAPTTAHLDVHAAAGHEVVGRQAADRRGRRLDTSTARDEEWLNHWAATANLPHGDQTRKRS